MKRTSAFLLIYGLLSLLCFVMLMGLLLYSYEAITRPVPDVDLETTFIGDRILNDDPFASFMACVYPCLYYVGRYESSPLPSGSVWWLCNVATTLMASLLLAFLPTKITLDLLVREK